MGAYNLIDEPWLEVAYKDKTSLVGLETLFEDADDISHIVTPSFNGRKAFVYDPPVYFFLATIVMAANFKPENSFKAGTKAFAEELFKNGLDTDLILAYLDEYHDCFDLFDPEKPFLQNPALAGELSEAYVPKISPVSPSANAPVFGYSQRIGSNGDNFFENIKFTVREYVYALLYQVSIGTSINSTNYPNKSLASKSTVYVIPHGKTLAETIALNCVTLSESPCPNPAEPDQYYDRPAWEGFDLSLIEGTDGKADGDLLSAVFGKDGLKWIKES